METEEMRKLCESLSKSEIDGPVIKIKKGDNREGVDSSKMCLVGKVLSRKKVNTEAFRNVMLQIWSCQGKVEVEEVSNNTFAFYFKHSSDKELIWSRGPWHFNNNLIILERPNGLGEVDKMEFRYIEIWVQIYNVPLACKNRRMAQTIVEAIGDIIELPVENKDCWGKYIRAKVRIDVTKPLKRSAKIWLEEYNTMVVTLIRYERLPDFCFVCGRIGHVWRDCSDNEGRNQYLKGEGAEYGQWLRVDTPGKIKKTTQKQLEWKNQNTPEQGKSMTEEDNLQAKGEALQSLKSLSIESSANQARNQIKKVTDQAEQLNSEKGLNTTTSMSYEDQDKKRQARVDKQQLGKGTHKDKCEIVEELKLEVDVETRIKKVSELVERGIMDSVLEKGPQTIKNNTDKIPST